VLRVNADGPRRQQNIQSFPGHFRIAISENFLGALVEENNALLLIDRDDRVVGEIENSGERIR
jgi:hypothetical protein